MAFLDGSTTLAAQTVRIEPAVTGGNEMTGAGGRFTGRPVTIFGVRDHPDDAVADTDIAKGYRFTHEGSDYRVKDVSLYPGEIQAFAERQT